MVVSTTVVGRFSSPPPPFFFCCWPRVRRCPCVSRWCYSVHTVCCHLWVRVGAWSRCAQIRFARMFPAFRMYMVITPFQQEPLQQEPLQSKSDINNDANRKYQIMKYTLGTLECTNFAWSNVVYVSKGFDKQNSFVSCLVMFAQFERSTYNLTQHKTIQLNTKTCSSTKVFISFFIESGNSQSLQGESARRKPRGVCPEQHYYYLPLRQSPTSGGSHLDIYFT